MADINETDEQLESWGTPGPPANAKIQPYADMPGTHANEAKGAAISAMWAVVLTGLSGLFLAVGASSISTDEYANGESTPLIILAAVLGLSGVVLWAVALWKYLMHRSNEYALMVAQVRASGGFPQAVLDEFKTEAYIEADTKPAGTQQTSGNEPQPSTD